VNNAGVHLAFGAFDKAWLNFDKKNKVNGLSLDCDRQMLECPKCIRSPILIQFLSQ
jgi:hypothetical protein